MRALLPHEQKPAVFCKSLCPRGGPGSAYSAAPTKMLQGRVRRFPATCFFQPTFLYFREGMCNKSSYQQCKKKYLCYYEYIIKSPSFYTVFRISYINKVNSIVIGMCNRNKHTDFNVKLTYSGRPPHPPRPIFCCFSGA